MTHSQTGKETEYNLTPYEQTLPVIFTIILLVKDITLVKIMVMVMAEVW